ncbi:MAG: GPW/gp25 family protein [Candidimonas sp.]
MARAAQKNIFYGFSTIDRDQTNNRLVDMSLIKRDLLNHFYTHKGERLMYPNYGFIGWDMLFEPLTEGNKDLIIKDAERILNSDSRVETVSTRVIEHEHGFEIRADLLYRPFDIVETFTASFDRRSSERQTTEL